MVSKKRERPSNVSMTPETSPSQPRQRTPASVPSLANVRYDCLDHWPVSGNKLRRKLCEEKRPAGVTIKEAKSRVACSKCKVPLCFTSEKSCFMDYHRKHYSEQKPILQVIS